MKTKDIIFSLTLILLFQDAFMAQDTLLVSPIKIDSLHRLIINRENNDEEKIRLLNEYARYCFFNQEFQLGFVSTRDAREMSKKLNYKGGEVMYYMTLAVFLGSGEMYNFYLQQARNVDLKENNKFSEYTVEFDIPVGYPSNNHQIRLDKLAPVLQYFEDLDDKEIQLAIMVQMAWSYYSLGRINELTIILKKAASLSRDLKQLYPEFLAYSRLKLLLDSEGNTEEGKKLEQQMIDLLSKSKDQSEKAYLNFIQANFYNNSGQYALAIDYYLKSIDAFEYVRDFNMVIEVYKQLGYAYETLDMQAKALEIYEKLISLLKELNNNSELHHAYNRPVFPLYELKRYDDARKYMALALQGANEQDSALLMAKSNSLEGQILLDQGAYNEAIPYLQKTYETYSKLENNQTAKYTISFTLMYITECCYKKGDLNNALKYALECLDRENELNSNRTIIKNKISFLISKIYNEMGQPEKAFDYIKLYQDIIEEANNIENTNRVAEAEIRSVIDKSENKIEQLEKEQTQKAQENRIQRLWIFSISGALISALILSIVLYRNNKNKQKANALLKVQKEEIQTTLEKLESTQSQLIQSEKMASLGELTAGIAHEIQNPLNFVNNFSEVNDELLDDLKEAISNNDQEEIEAIYNDLKANESKIKHHGQRAEGIVKGMLQHSRTSQGEKEPTDINALADEYLRLAYHGLRAKDKSFNADFKTDFDPNLPKVNVIPQDIGRVLLNLINNAFYAVSQNSQRPSEQSRSLPAGRQESYDYKPLVTVSTKILPPTPLPTGQAGSRGGQKGIEITVSDNGPGIPDSIKDKIFQPFFTTKPTGQGTGLGLSLSYDIVKAHGGELKIDSAESKGTTFKITIPIT